MKNTLLLDYIVITIMIFLNFSSATMAIYDRTSSEKILAANRLRPPRDPKQHSFSKQSKQNNNKNQSITNIYDYNEFTKYSFSDLCGKVRGGVCFLWLY